MFVAAEDERRLKVYATTDWVGCGGRRETGVAVVIFAAEVRIFWLLSDVDSLKA